MWPKGERVFGILFLILAAILVYADDAKIRNIYRIRIS